MSGSLIALSCDRFVSTRLNTLRCGRGLLDPLSAAAIGDEVASAAEVAAGGTPRSSSTGSAKGIVGRIVIGLDRDKGIPGTTEDGRAAERLRGLGLPRLDG